MLNDYNLTMLTDFYEITMANGYFNSDIKDAEACFDVFFRRVPDGGGFAIMAGLEQIIAYMKRLSKQKMLQRGVPGLPARFQIQVRRVVGA